MMFVNRFVCTVKVNGKILREQSNLVTLPFGAEYEILLKNLNSRRAMVKVSVDGQDATDGTRLILQPNASVTLERFIKNGNLSRGNRFKFIERSAGIESHRGIKEDDGLIRAEFWAEKEVIERPIIREKYYDDWYPVPRPYYTPSPWPRPWRRGPGWPYQGTMCSTGPKTSYSTRNRTMGPGAASGPKLDRMSSTPMCSSGGITGQSIGGFQGAMNVNCSSLNDAGITVPGSESNQQFHSASGFPLESNSHVIILQLRGEVGGVPVEVPVTVDRKPECVTCGKVNKATNRFCSECGTALVLI